MLVLYGLIIVVLFFDVLLKLNIDKIKKYYFKFYFNFMMYCFLIVGVLLIC